LLSTRPSFSDDHRRVSCCCRLHHRPGMGDHRQDRTAVTQDMTGLYVSGALFAAGMFALLYVGLHLIP
jgi:hypothetical protein